MEKQQLVELGGSRMERRLGHLELHSLGTVKDSVADFYHRIPSKNWSPDTYPVESEKELYAELAHILLAAPHAMVPALLRSFGTRPANELADSCGDGLWRCYRLSTIRFEKGVRWSGPICFPGAACSNVIADIGLFQNPRIDQTAGMIVADRLVYLEIKSADHRRHASSHLLPHLKHLAEETPDGAGYLGAVGGKRPAVNHPRWLGHVGLLGLLEHMAEVAASLHNSALADEVQRLAARKRRRG